MKLSACRISRPFPAGFLPIRAQPFSCCSMHRQAKAARITAEAFDAAWFAETKLGPKNLTGPKAPNPKP